MTAKNIPKTIVSICLSVLITSLLYSLLVVLPSASGAYAQEGLNQQKIKQLLGSVQTSAVQGMGPSQVPAEAPRFSVTKEGYLRNLGAPPAYHFPVTSVVPGMPEETAQNFLKEHANLFGVTSAAVGFRFLKTKSKNDRSYVRFEQIYGGVSVFGAQTIVQINALGGVEYVLSDIARNTSILDDGILSIIPLIPPEGAEARARNLVIEKIPDAAVRTTEPELKIFDPAVVGASGDMGLVWDVKVYSEQIPSMNKHFLLDAHRNEIVREYPLNRFALNREVFDSNNSTADPGTRRRAEGDPASGIADVDNAYDYLGDAYRFFHDYHGRDGINGSGMVISATVRYCSNDQDICGNPPQCPCANSFWSSFNDRLYFGDGEVAADDVVGHEYTHGVTHFESDLVYENQSGAIDESFSDTWGEFIDLTNGRGNDTAAVRWQLFEDTGWASRDMKNPPSHSQPDRMGSDLYYHGSNDHGGVHTNSGVGNKLVYLLTDGDTFNGQHIVGRGISRVADLYYEVNTNLLSSGADYADLCHGLKQAAVNLGWIPEERNNIHRGCLAVEIADAGKDIYVDNQSIWPFEDGSELFPYKTVNKANDAAYPGDRIRIKSGTYNEAVFFRTIMDIFARDGQVKIGQ